MTDAKLTAAADPPDGAPRPKASIHRLTLSPPRYVGPSPWRAPKRVSVSLWDAASRQVERPPMRRLAA
jgi:hypothetical protein